MTIRTEYAGNIPTVLEQKVGRYLVQVYEHSNPYLPDQKPQYVYRVLLNGREIKCWTDADERTFPKRAGMAGHLMVEELKRRAEGA